MVNSRERQSDEAARPTMRGFKIAHAELRKKLAAAETRVARLLAWIPTV